MTRISFEAISETLQRVLCSVAFSNNRAELCARLFADSSRDGIYSHGLNRFARFIETIIEASGRPLPIGYWKGSGLSLLLDAVAAVLSDGSATNQIPGEVVRETRLSQVFIAFAASETDSEKTLNGILEFMKSASSEATVRYPGERTLETRKENLRDGIPVEPHIWDAILKL